MREKQVPGQKTHAKATFLAHTNLFQHLKPAEISELESVTMTGTYPARRILYRPGEDNKLLFLLQAGCVQLYHLSPDGRKLITATLQAGSCFGDLLLGGQGNSFAETIEDTFVYMINKHDLKLIIQQNPSISYALLQLVGLRQAEIEAQLVDIAFKSTTARLANLLLRLAQPQDHLTARTLVVAGLSHEELADRLGVYRETVSTALRELKETGAIELGRKHITISRPAMLTDVAATVKH